jgi:transcriptional regulator with XRE-family HTH domain
VGQAPGRRYPATRAGDGVVMKRELLVLIFSSRLEVKSMLKDARKPTGMSIEQAAFRLHIGYRTLVNYENGHSIAPPEVVLGMEEVYENPNLHATYCSEVCPIGQKYAHRLENRGIAEAVLRLLRDMDVAQTEVRTKLVEIACDGKIEGHEIDGLKSVLCRLLHLERSIGLVKVEAADVVPELMAKEKGLGFVAESRATYQTI